MDFYLNELMKDTHNSGALSLHTSSLLLHAFIVLFYKHISGPEVSSELRGTDFTYSLLDSYVTPQTNEGPGFCRCKRGPVVNTYLLPMLKTWSKTRITQFCMKVTRLEFSLQFRFMCNLFKRIENGFCRPNILDFKLCLIVK
jgi:hypothetical protein